MIEPDWIDLANRALYEDSAIADRTTALIDRADQMTVEGRIVAEESFVVCGLPVVDAALRCFNTGGASAGSVRDGDQVDAGETLRTITADARTVLGIERVVLNFLQRLSGIATITRRAAAAAGEAVDVTDTRKTTPLLRDVEKYAVATGGGVNHRHSLADAVLFKDNHWALAKPDVEFFRQARATTDCPFQVEIETEEQLDIVVEAEVDFVLIDNQPPETIRQWRERLGPDVVIEASGGIELDQIAAYAAAGVNRISMGALTHSAPSVSIKMEIGV